MYNTIRKKQSSNTKILKTLLILFLKKYIIVILISLKLDSYGKFCDLYKSYIIKTLSYFGLCQVFWQLGKTIGQQSIHTNSLLAQIFTQALIKHILPPSTALLYNKHNQKKH